MSENADSCASITKAINDLIEQLAELRSRGYPEIELAEIETNLERMKHARELVKQQLAVYSSPPTPEQRAMSDFIERLMTRQGTTMPDFDALHRKKAEFDRKLSDP